MSALSSAIIESRLEGHQKMRPMLLFIQARSVRPRSCVFSDLVSKYSNAEVAIQLQKWRWVSKTEIETCVEHKRPICEWNPQELMTRFAIVNRVKDGKGLATWISEHTCAIESEIIPDDCRMRASETYLPQQWADAIVDLYGQGVMRLRTSGSRIILAEMRTGETRTVYSEKKNQYMVGPQFSNIGDR